MNVKLIKIALFLILTFLNFHLCYGQWQASHGLEGGYCRDIIETDTSLLMKSTELFSSYGQEWQEIPEGPIFTFFLKLDSCIIGYGPMKGTYRSFDNGLTWNSLSYLYEAMSYMAASHNCLFDVGENREIIRSFDFGDSWDTIASEYNFSAPQVCGYDSLIVIFDENTAYKSVDYGNNWDSIQGLDYSHYHIKPLFVYQNDLYYYQIFLCYFNKLSFQTY